VIFVQRRRLLLYPAYVQDYLDRVTAADVAAGNTSGLEMGVTDAASTFLQDLVSISYLGVSSNVISQAASIIKAAPILAGARTLAGALTPLVGPAPTNNGFTDDDYSRKTGLKGNGSSKYLVTNRLLNEDPRIDSHLSAFKNDAISAANPYYIGGYNAAATVVSAVGEGGLFINSAITPSAVNSSVGLHGASRSSSSSALIKRPGAAVATFSSASTGTLAISPYVFTLNANGSPGSQFSASSLTWYSQGLSLSLTSLDGRISTLMAALSAAIP
jgi:hypothetical protein